MIASEKPARELLPNTSLQLLLREVNRLLRNINTINPEFAKHIDCCSLLTTIAENLIAMSHFKHETFSVRQYAMDFETISKESIKWIRKWKASYFTHPASYYPVPQTSMPRSAAKFITSLSANSLVLHCASLLRTIFASLARTNERVYVRNIRDFHQTKLDSEINSPFLLNEHVDPRFFYLFIFSCIW